MVTIQDFIGNTAISSKVKRVDANPNMEDMGAGARHFLITLKAGRFTMRVPFSQGSAHTVAPTTADVLDCLAMDAAGYENARSFDDWASEYGYDTDSRKAERIYKVCQRAAASLKRFVGSADVYQALLFDTERL